MPCLPAAFTTVAAAAVVGAAALSSRFHSPIFKLPLLPPSATVSCRTVCVCVCVGHAAPDSERQTNFWPRPIPSLPSTWSSIAFRRLAGEAVSQKLDYHHHHPPPPQADPPNHSTTARPFYFSSRLARHSFVLSHQPRTAAISQGFLASIVSADPRFIFSVLLLASSPIHCQLGHSFVPPRRNLYPRQPFGFLSSCFACTFLKLCYPCRILSTWPTSNAGSANFRTDTHF